MAMTHILDMPFAPMLIQAISLMLYTPSIGETRPASLSFLYSSLGQIMWMCLAFRYNSHVPLDILDAYWYTYLCMFHIGKGEGVCHIMHFRMDFLIIYL